MKTRRLSVTGGCDARTRCLVRSRRLRARPRQAQSAVERGRAVECFVSNGVQKRRRAAEAALRSGNQRWIWQRRFLRPCGRGAIREPPTLARRFPVVPGTRPYPSVPPLPVLQETSTGPPPFRDTNIIGTRSRRRPIRLARSPAQSTSIASRFLGAPLSVLRRRGRPGERSAFSGVRRFWEASRVWPHRVADRGSERLIELDFVDSGPLLGERGADGLVQGDLEHAQAE